MPQSIEPLSDEEIEELMNQEPINQVAFLPAEEQNEQIETDR